MNGLGLRLDKTLAVDSKEVEFDMLWVEQLHLRVILLEYLHSTLAFPARWVPKNSTLNRCVRTQNK